jgi:hypothetical protein
MSVSKEVKQGSWLFTWSTLAFGVRLWLINPYKISTLISGHFTSVFNCAEAMVKNKKEQRERKIIFIQFDYKFLN